MIEAPHKSLATQSLEGSESIMQSLLSLNTSCGQTDNLLIALSKHEEKERNRRKRIKQEIERTGNQASSCERMTWNYTLFCIDLRRRKSTTINDQIVWQFAFCCKHSRPQSIFYIFPVISFQLNELFTDSVNDLRSVHTDHITMRVCDSFLLREILYFTGKNACESITDVVRTNNGKKEKERITATIIPLVVRSNRNRNQGKFLKELYAFSFLFLWKRKPSRRRITTKKTKGRWKFLLLQNELLLQFSTEKKRHEAEIAFKLISPEKGSNERNKKWTWWPRRETRGRKGQIFFPDVSRMNQSNRGNERPLCFWEREREKDKTQIHDAWIDVQRNSVSCQLSQKQINGVHSNSSPEDADVDDDDDVCVTSSLGHDIYARTCLLCFFSTNSEEKQWSGGSYPVSIRLHKSIKYSISVDAEREGKGRGFRTEMKLPLYQVLQKTFVVLLISFIVIIITMILRINWQVKSITGTPLPDNIVARKDMNRSVVTTYTILTTQEGKVDEVKRYWLVSKEWFPFFSCDVMIPMILQTMS